MIQGNSDEALKKFEQVADEYGNRFGNVAHLNAAILLSQKEKYPEALKHLEKYDPEGDVVGPESQSLMGDCYVNLKKYPEALSCYDKAISQIDVYDVNGKLVKTFTTVGSSINVSDLSDGIYMLNMQTEEGLVVRKIVKE